MSVDLDGVFLWYQICDRDNEESGGGSIINMSPIEGMVGGRRLPRL